MAKAMKIKIVLASLFLLVVVVFFVRFVEIDIFSKPAKPLSNKIHSASIVQLLVHPERYKDKRVAFFGLLSNKGHPWPVMYLSKNFADVFDSSSSILIGRSATITVLDLSWNVYQVDDLSVLDGCFVEIVGYFTGQSALYGDVSIYVRDDCKSRLQPIGAE